MAATLDDYKLSFELIGHSMDVRSVAVGWETDEGQVIISGSRDKTVKLWKRLGGIYAETVTFQDHKNFIACVCYLPTERWICTGSNDSTVAIYKEDGYIPILMLKGHESTVCAIAAGCEPLTIITGSWDKTARIWTIDQSGGMSALVLRGHEAAVWTVACMASVKKYITGAADKVIYYWNAKGEKLRMLKGHTDCVRGILSFPNNETLASCANDALIKLWNDDGECIQEMSGHTNYIYSVAANSALGDNVIVSCGEDSTLRMWNLASGQELGDAIIHPAQSVWSVACLKNGDIVTGSSDGVVRVFTKDATRYADEQTMKGFVEAVETRKAQMSDDIGGIKKTDLPGPESLLTNGTREGQTKMVRHQDGSVKCYAWQLGQWNLVGDVTGATGGTQANSGKTLYEGKEYDYVFSVDISDTEPPIKLPYNRNEDPWHAAQQFIHRNNLPQVYLDQVANFIIKNSSTTRSATAQPTTSGYQDPFTGGSRYVPGSSNQNFNAAGNLDPFTGASSYSTAAAGGVAQPAKAGVKGEKHFPVSNYLTFDNCDPTKVLEKLKEFNSKLSNESEKVSDTLLNAVIELTSAQPEVDTSSIEALQHLLRWPNDILFPVLDVARLAIRHEPLFAFLNSSNFLDNILPKLNSSAPNTLMIIRCLANMMRHEAGRKQIEPRLANIAAKVDEIKTGSANLQIAIATFYLNVSISQTLNMANSELCRIVTEGTVELLKWATDLEACYRAMQAIGNLTTTPFGQEAIAIVVSVDYVMDKIRGLTNTPQAGVYVKLNSAGSALLAAF